MGRELYEKFFKNYTRKQWGLDPSELDASVIARIPVRTNRDDRYFADTYQVMPQHGYTRMFERMLGHPNIKVLLNADYQEVRNLIPHREVVFTGPVDEFFDYRYGRLPYRSLQFKFETLDQEVAQAAPVINYPNDGPWTRVTEFKYLTGQVHPKTTLVYELPDGRGRPVLPGSASGEPGAVPEIRGAGRGHAATCTSSAGWPRTSTTTWTRWWRRR